MNSDEGHRRPDSASEVANDELLRSGVLVVSLFVAAALINGLLAIAFIELLDALGSWNDGR